MRRGLLALTKTFLIVMGVITGLSTPFALLLGATILETLSVILLLGGLVMIVVSGLVGGGVGGMGLSSAQMWGGRVSRIGGPVPHLYQMSTYRKAFTQHPPRWDPDRLQFMILGLLVGALSLTLSVLVSFGLIQ